MENRSWIKINNKYFIKERRGYMDKFKEIRPVVLGLVKKWRTYFIPRSDLKIFIKKIANSFIELAIF